MKFNIHLFLMLFLFISCEKDTLPKDIKLIINNSTNKVELMNFINHYKQNNNDNLKLNAAYFLIRNMEGLESLDSISVSGNSVYFDSFYKKMLEKGSKLNNDTFYFLTDSINNTINKNLYSPLYHSDLEVLSSAQLIKNHELSFYAWRNFPWSRNVSFEDFCEYILPYRCSETYSIDAREIFMNKYKWIVDSLKGSTNPLAISKIISNDIDSWFTEDPSLFFKYHYLHDSSFLDRLKGRVGNCNIKTEIKITAMRALGIPVGYDFLKWANANSNHYLYKVIDNEYITKDNLLTNIQDTIDTNHIIDGSFYGYYPKLAGVPDKVNIYYKRTVSKVYRKTLKKNNSFASSVLRDFERIKDVTNEYVQCANLIYQIPSEYKNEKNIILLTFDNINWVFQCIGKHRKMKNNVLFENLGKNIVYIPAIIENGNYTFIDYPFLLDGNGEMKKFIPKSEIETVTLYNKYPFRSIIEIWFSFMLGGKFKVSNTKNLSDAKIIFTIDSLPFYEEVTELNVSNKYKYLIYDYSEIENFRFDVGNIMFYDKQNPLTLNSEFSLFGNNGLYGHTIKEAFDNDKLSFFADNTSDKNKFIAIEFNNASSINRISFLPRNDDNGINENEFYELYYWNYGWKSLGVQKGKKTITFENVPCNSLLLLKSTKGGTENRVFSYKDGKQMFW